MESTKKDCEGVIYVISRVMWYCHLSKLIEGDNNQQALPDLREAIASLYQLILSYLIAIVCINHFNSYDGTPLDSMRYASDIRQSGIHAVIAAGRGLPFFNGSHIEDPIEPRASQFDSVDGPQQDKGSSVNTECQSDLVKKLGVVKSHHTIPQLPMRNAKDPSCRLYHELLSKTQYEKFRDWSKADRVNRLLCISGGLGSGKT